MPQCRSFLYKPGVFSTPGRHWTMEVLFFWSCFIVVADSVFVGVCEVAGVAFPFGITIAVAASVPAAIAAAVAPSRRITYSCRIPVLVVIADTVFVVVYKNSAPACPVSLSVVIRISLRAKS